MSWLCWAVPLALIASFAVLRLVGYRKLFTTGHFIELAGQLARIRELALREMDPAKATDQIDLEALRELEAQSFSTSAGLCGVYTVKRSGGEFVHYFSMSWRGSFLAMSGARYFLGFARRFLGLADADFRLRLSSRGVYHLSFALTGERHQSVARHVPQIPGPADFPALFTECGVAGQEMVGAVESVSDDELLGG